MILTAEAKLLKKAYENEDTKQFEEELKTIMNTTHHLRILAGDIGYDNVIKILEEITPTIYISMFKDSGR